MPIIPYDKHKSALVAEFFREIFTEMGWKERSSDYMDQPDLLFHLPDKGMLLLIKENNNIIGTAGLILLTPTDGLIKRFYLNKSYRGTGFAKVLLDGLMKKAALRGVKKILLDVSRKNTRAIRFYEKNGFIKTDITPQKGWEESYTPETFCYFYKMI